MASQRKIAILLHEKDRCRKTNSHFIWALCDVWRERGIEIEVVKGIQKHVETDLLIPHVDATVLPQEYADFLDNYPRVVNRLVRDISKRLVSENLLSRADSCDGEVIVKTNLNCGGAPDVNFPGPKIFFSTQPAKNFWRAWLHRKRKETSFDWGKVNCMNSDDYQLFPSLKAVPEVIFENPALVVERFLPECENGIYYLRVYKFFGDQAYCARLGSPHPIVKQKNIVSREEVSIPDEVVAVRRKLGLDYGKIDFVVREGRVVVFDVNRTPGWIKSARQRKASALKLAAGVENFFLS